MPASEKKGLSVVVIVVIVMAVLGLVGTVALGALGYYLFKENFGADRAAKVAADIVELPDPLPEGWQYGVGMATLNQKIVNLVHRGKGRFHPLVQFTLIGTKGFTAKTMAGKLHMPSMTGMTFQEESRGEETIGGTTAYYIRYRCKVMNRDSAMELALADARSGHIVQIQTTEDGKTSYDPAPIKPLFDSIKGFKGEI